MAKPILVDFFCKQGGASKGFADAGFEVIGVDWEPQPHYPFEFHRADALGFLDAHASWIVGNVDLIAGSPPCQAHTLAQRIQGREHADLIVPFRSRLLALRIPFVIENVPGAPLRQPVELCGAMFGLETYRHRLFETSFPLTAPVHPEHRARSTKMGRPPQPGEFMQIVGNFSGADRAREVMGTPWMTRDGLREAIPPAYTQWIGEQFLAQQLKEAS